MTAGRIIAYLVAALFFFFGALFVLGAFSPSASSPGGWIVIGVVLVGIAFVLIWFAGRLGKRAEETTIVQKIDLSGDISLAKLTCRNCGGSLTTDNIKMVAGAPVVNCPYCGTSYQLEEAPKW